MPTIAAMFCRLWGCGSGEKVDLAESSSAMISPADMSRSDDLTEIRGIGITMQNNLHKAGIKTFAALAASTPDQIRNILGARAKGAQVEEWISQAAKLGKAS
jgi:predicted flap endonuclease-1-like 5' DNA nuclease